MFKRIIIFLEDFWYYFRQMWIRFYRHGGPMSAAAISFYFLLSAVPLTLFGISIASKVIGSPEKVASLIVALTNIQGLLPDGTVHFGSFFHTIVGQASVVSQLSIVLLLIFSAGVFLTIESAVNRIFERQENRPLWRQLLFAYILMMLTYLGLLGSSGLTWVAILISDFGVSFLGLSSSNLSVFWKWFFRLAPIAWLTLLFTLIYKIIPHRKVKWRYAFAGGLFAGIFWEFAKRLFNLYITYVIKFNELYGGLSAILATLVWVFYTAAIMILGAALAMSLIKGKKLVNSEQQEDKT